MNNPLVSVIIPVYNVEKYLEQCVQSVLDQTYTNLEIILIDDGSTDDSGKMCDAFAVKDSRIRVLHKDNEGSSSARNCGFEHANGDFIYYLDSDDYIKDITIEACINKLIETKSDFVFFGADSFANNDSIVSQNYRRNNIYSFGSGIEIFSNLQQNREFHAQVCLMLFAKSFLINNNLKFVDKIVFEDMPFTFQVYCLADRVSYLPNNFYQRRYRPDSIMTSSVSVKKFESLCIVVYELVRFCEDREIVDKVFAKQYIVRNSFNALNIYSALAKNEREKCKSSFDDLKALLKVNDFFGDQALRARTLGKIPWAVVRLIQKAKGN